MNYEYDRPWQQQLNLDSFEEQLLLGLQICGELLVQSRDAILAALAYQGWVEQGRCLVIVDITEPTEFSGAIDLPIGIMYENDPGVKIIGAEKLLQEYNPQEEAVLVLSHTKKDYSMTSSCIFTPCLPPRVCYEEVMNRPSEFDFTWVDNETF